MRSSQEEEADLPDKVRPKQSVPSQVTTEGGHGGNEHPIMQSTGAGGEYYRGQ
jgi:hypothetical protein